MKCVICKTGETEESQTTVTLQREETVVVVKGVPAQVCQECGEYYLSEEVTRRVHEQGEAAVKRHAEVEVVRYAA